MPNVDVGFSSLHRNVIRPYLTRATSLSKKALRPSARAFHRGRQATLRSNLLGIVRGTA